MLRRRVFIWRHNGRSARLRTLRSRRANQSYGNTARDHRGADDVPCSAHNRESVCTEPRNPSRSACRIATLQLRAGDNKGNGSRLRWYATAGSERAKALLRMAWRTRAAQVFLAVALTACAHPTNPTTSPTPGLPQRVGAAPQVARSGAPSSSTPASTAIDVFQLQELFKRLTDLSFMAQLGPEMIVRKITYSGEDKLPIPAYFFAPKDTLRAHAALILVHDGIHSG